MREVITFLGILAVIVVMAMICRCPEAKETFSKEHRKSLAIIFIPMIALLVLAYYLLSHVGL